MLTFFFMNGHIRQSFFCEKGTSDNLINETFHLQQKEILV
jgi:hypothetical protein